MGVEANVPAEQPPAGEDPRVPVPHVDPGRPRHLEGAPEPRTAQADPLIVDATAGADSSGRGSAAAPSGKPTVWRIRDQRTFTALRASRLRRRCGPVTVTFVADNRGDPPRVAYAIGRKAGGAVVRNRLRRRLRAIVGEVASQLRPGAYLIGVAPGAATLTFGDLRTHVTKALLEAPGEER